MVGVAGTGEVDRAQAAKQRLKRHRAARGLQPGGTAIPSNGERVSLEEQLLVYTAADADPVPQQLLRKYIAYARAHVHPVLSDAAKQVRPAKHSDLLVLAGLVLARILCGCECSTSWHMEKL